MKFPDDFTTKLWNSPSPIGESFARAQKNLDMPFVKTYGTQVDEQGNIVQVIAERKNTKTNVFVERVQSQTEPWLWGEFNRNADERFYSTLDPAAARYVNVAFTSQPTASFSLSSFALYVGDGYLVRIAAWAGGYMPELLRPALGVQVLASASAAQRAGKSISYAGIVPLIDDAGVGESAMTMSVFVGGWKDSNARYTFGFAGLDPIVPAQSFVGTPKMWTGDTATQQMQERTPPLETGRKHIGFRVFNAGPGRLEYLHAVLEEIDHQTVVDGVTYTFMKPQIAPWIARSTDHGATWTRAPANFLVPFLINGGDLGPNSNRAVWTNQQLITLCIGARIIYLGDNRTLLVADPCWLGGTTELVDQQWATLAFVGTSGAYSRAPWPADAWISTSQLAPPVPTARGGYSGYFFAAHYSFGNGKAYVPVNTSGPNEAVLVTQDFGASWALSPPLPAGMAQDGAVFGTIERPGSILFSVPDFAAKAITVFRTQDAFNSFQTLGPARSIPNLYNDGLGYGNRYLVNIGSLLRRPYVYPAHPGAFDEPP